MNKSNPVSPEVLAWAERMVREPRGKYLSLRAAVDSMTSKIGCVP